MKTRTRVYAVSILSSLLYVLNSRLAGRPAARIALTLAYVISIEMLARKRKRRSLCTCPEADHNPGCPAADPAGPAPIPEQGV